MALLGLVYRPPTEPHLYYSTPLSQHLLSGTNASRAAAIAPPGTMDSVTVHPSAETGFIIIETNFRVYAHTNSPLWAQILRLFVRIEYLLPNLIVGSLTRESIQAAGEQGIPASEIISFLERNAHPRMANQSPVLPETAVNQVRVTLASLRPHPSPRSPQSLSCLCHY